MLARVAAALLLLSASSSLAAGWPPPSVPASQGDLLAAYYSHFVEVPSGGVFLYGDDGSAKGAFAWDAAMSVSEDPAGNIDVVSGSEVRVYSRTGTLLRTFGKSTPEAFGVAFDRAGHTFVAATRLDEFDAAGNFITSFPVEAFDLDMDADQCSLFYTETLRRVRRFDVCTGTALPDLLPTLPAGAIGAFRLRLLRDGTVLVAVGDRILRVARDGTIVRTYADAEVSGWETLAVSVDGRSFWAGGESGIAKFDLASGRRLAPAIGALATALAVAGEPRMAFIAAPPAPSVPVLSDAALLLAAALLALAAMLRLQ